MTRKFTVTVNGVQYDVDVEEKKDLAKNEIAEKDRQSAISKSNSSKKEKISTLDPKSEKILSPMPGSILEMNVKIGQEVKKGEPLCVLEAMKMETDIVSPRDGLIQMIHVVKGASVNAGDVLIEMRR